MVIEKVIIENIKSIKKIEFMPNEKFNMIVGENNIGKTTIFDAILLWKMAYDELILANGKSFYKKSSWNSLNVTFTKLLIFRIVKAKDLFSNPKRDASITLVIKTELRMYELKIELNIPSIEDSYIRFNNAKSHQDFLDFAIYCQENNLKLKNAIKINFSRPISSIIREEPFLNRAQIRRKMYTGHTHEILRNQILLTMQQEKFEYLEKKLLAIMNKNFKLRFKNKNRDEDEFITITIEENYNEVYLSLVGSGILHILQIFSSVHSIDSNSKELNILLIDEPDSHLHTDIQLKLVDSLKEESSQIFLITHNDRMKDKADNGELFYFSQKAKDSGILNSLSPDFYYKVENGLAKSVANKPIIITEGKTDWKHLKKALETFNKDNKYKELNIDFLEYEDEIEMGDGQLESMLKAYSKTMQSKVMIFIFDRDVDKYKKNYGRENYNNHKNKVYSLCIPKIDDRLDNISIEFYYKPDDLKILDEDGRRLFLGEEFYQNGNSIDGVFQAKEQNKCSKLTIIDSKVYSRDDLEHKNSIALSKNDFANNILNEVKPFDKIDFSNFEKVFDVIKDITQGN